jgi:competence CoiA-like predicted nuclease
MSQLLSLGAINKQTNEYVYPKIANKKDEYICLECNKDLVLCQGEIRVHHFRHKVDSINPCHHYSNPTETQIHKDAKMLIKTLLERKISISLIRNCCCCKKNETFQIPEIDESSVIKLEYRFEYNGLKIADVAYIDDNDLLCIFEICNTHKTSSENRPEPWFEVNAKTLIKIANDNSLTSLEIPCIRYEKCDNCIETENANLKDNNIEKYVRIKLGQKIFPTPIMKGCEFEDENDCKCDRCKYDEWYNTFWKKEGHLRINFDAREDIANNKQIVELFDEDFMNKKIVIHSWKGSACAYVISKLSYNKYDYWKEKFDDNSLSYPCEKIIDITFKSTIKIIIELIKYCKNVSIIKQEKIKTIKNDIINIDNKRQQLKKDIDIDDDADILRSMRYDKQINNYKMSLTQELIFIKNDINYTLGNNVIVIEHPLTHTKLRRSLVNNKTYYKGKWRTDISVKLIINWYNSNNDFLDKL